MNVIDSLTSQANRIASDVQSSLKRARTEGERRLLLRQHRAALEALGERAYELVASGQLPGDQLAPEVAEVESKLMEIESKVNEIDSLRPDDERSEESEPTDPSKAAFPMVRGDQPNGSQAGPGPGWEATERFFSDDS